MSFPAFLTRHLSARDTGQLVVQFVGVPHLCKISLEEGQAVYVSLGTLGPEETLAYLAGKAPLKASFIPGVPPRKRLAQPLNERLLALAGSRPLARTVTPMAAAPAPGTGVPPQRTEEVIADFVDRIGPLGQILAERALSQIGGGRGDSLPAEIFAAFVGALQAELPEEERPQFGRRHLR